VGWGVPTHNPRDARTAYGAPDHLPADMWPHVAGGALQCSGVRMHPTCAVPQRAIGAVVVAPGGTSHWRLSAISRRLLTTPASVRCGSGGAVDVPPGDHVHSAAPALRSRARVVHPTSTSGSFPATLARQGCSSKDVL
jgi:hypothetical protein